jgi:transposase
MTQQRRFTKEFAEEAVRLVPSGRTQREIGGDLGIGLSTLVRWIGRSRDRQAADPSATQSDVAAELKRLRRENEILRQERDILKKATAFFCPGGKSMRFALIDGAKTQFPVRRHSARLRKPHAVRKNGRPMTQYLSTEVGQVQRVFDEIEVRQAITKRLAKAAARDD